MTSIYFTRRLRSPHIDPILLGPADSMIVLESFKAYALKVLRRLGNGDTSVWITKEEIENKALSDLLDDLTRESNRLGASPILEAPRSMEVPSSTQATPN